MRRSPRRKGGKKKPDDDDDEEGEEEEEEEEPQQANHDEERIQKDKYRRFCNMLLREAREYFDRSNQQPTIKMLLSWDNMVDGIR